MLTGPLAQRFQVTAIGNCGSGRSAKPPGPYTVQHRRRPGEFPVRVAAV